MGIRMACRVRRCAGNQDLWHIEPRPWFQSVDRAIHRCQKSGVAVYRHSFSNRAGLAAV